MYDDLTMTGLNNLFKSTYDDYDYVNEFNKNYEKIEDLSERIMMKDFYMTDDSLLLVLKYISTDERSILD